MKQKKRRKSNKSVAITQELFNSLTLHEAFQRSNDVMFYCDKEGKILDVNDAFTQHYGYSRAEVLGKSPNILRSKHSTDELYKRMWANILNPQKGYWRGQMINKTKDGREIPLILTITAIKDSAGQVQGYLSNALDMSEQFTLKARLADSEALATVGEMVAVVAHEIRNPLTSIVMAAKQLAGDTLGREDREMILRVLRSESQRLNEALTNFLVYARPREVTLQRGDLNVLIEEICRMVESNRELVKDIIVSVSLTPHLKPFPIDSDQIRQVIWNIVLNAVQAMAGKGTLNVATGREGNWAYWRVRDTGIGIPAAAIPNIFKPFHTTKQRGTGLGLAIADRIVKAHGGRIAVESTHQGTMFTVYLPYIED